MPRLSRRRLLVTAGLGGLGGLLGLRLVLPKLSRPGPVRPLTPEQAAFVERCWAGLDRAKVWDLHVHLVGLGAGGTGCEVNPKMRSHLHPVLRLQYELYMAGSGVTDEEHADGQFLERLLALQRQANPTGKLLLFAFDRHVTPDGEEHPELSPFHTPNEYALELAARHPEFAACASVHPYRRDAVERLDAVAAAGARAIKWLPASMGIDPADARCDPFYRRLAELGLPLITHAGLELAVATPASEELGNPLRLRRPLQAGVRVVVAHCAGLGHNLDLDAPGQPEAESFDLFLRMMREPEWEGRLWGEISAMTAVNRCGRSLRETILAQDLHPRLVNGTDYPLPGVDLLFSTRRLVSEGYLTAEERRLANGIFERNPLLFDFVVKRSLRVDGTGFADAVFESARLFV